MKIETEIADFVCQYSDGLYSYGDHPYIERYALLHIKFGTLMVIKDNNEIIAICRWNMVTPKAAKILDFIVHPDYKHKNLAKKMLLRAKRLMPNLERISFTRKKKYPNRAEIAYPLSRWIKEKSWAEVQNLQ